MYSSAPASTYYAESFLSSVINNNKPNIPYKKKYEIKSVAEFTNSQRIALSLLSLPTNLGWAISEALIIPYLLRFGCPLYSISWIWLLSPVLSTTISPKMDEWSDDFNADNFFYRYYGWKGRKQILLLLSMISALCMFLLPHTSTFIIVLFDQQPNNSSTDEPHTHWLFTTFVCTVILFAIMDLCHYCMFVIKNKKQQYFHLKNTHKVLLRPLQALLWDIVCGNTTEYQNVFNTVNVVQQICRMIGYMIVAVCLSFVMFGGEMTHIASAFAMGSIFIVCFTVFALYFTPNPPEFVSSSLASFPINDDEYLPLNSNLKTNINYNGIIEEEGDDQSAYSFNSEQYPKQPYSGTFNRCQSAPSLMTTVSNYEQLHSNLRDNISENNYTLGIDTDLMNNDFDTDEDGMLNMSTLVAGYILWFAQFLGWISICLITLFWTSYTSIDVYRGNADAMSNSWQWEQFKYGLAFGAYGLLLMSLVSVICSMLYPWIAKCVSIRALFLIGECSMAAICMLFFIIENAVFLLVGCVVFGFAMQIHLQSSQALMELELQPIMLLLMKSRNGGSGKSVFEHLMEMGSVLAPVIVALFAGPVVYFVDGGFKYLFLVSGSVQLCLNILVLFIFAEFMPCKLVGQG